VLSAATGGFNTDTMSVSALGNYQTARPSNALVQGIEKVVAWKLGLFHRDPTGTTALISAGGGTDKWPVGASVTLNNISGHRDTGATACPGSYLYPYLPAIRAAAKIYQQSAFYDPAVSATVVTTPLTAPFALTTRTSRPMDYKVQIANSQGITVRTITGATLSAQTLSVPWDLKDDHGATVPDDFYTFTLSGGSWVGSAVPWSARVQFGKPDVPATPPLAAVYYTPGYQTYGGANYYTRCSYPTLQAKRCTVLKQMGYWARKGSTYVPAVGWLLYTTSYIAYDDQSFGLMAVPGRFSSGGYLWMTQCAPDVTTGPRTCWAYRWEQWVVRISGTGTASKFAIQWHWQYKALVSLSARPAPPPSPPAPPG